MIKTIRSDEARHRTAAPVCQGRRVALVGLDLAGSVLAEQAGAGRPQVIACSLEGQPRWLGQVDAVVLVGGTVDAPEHLSQLALACRGRGITLTGLVLQDGTASLPAVRQLRPHCTMLVLTGSGDYLDDLLTAFGV